MFSRILLISNHKSDVELRDVINQACVNFNESLAKPQVNTNPSPVKYNSF